MPSKREILSALGNVYIVPELLVEHQTTDDIVQGIRDTHIRWRHAYDRIAGYFEASTWDDTAEMLWKFCKDNLRYKEESVRKQQVSHPATMLRRGYCDCKGYALFIGGVLDALNRRSGYSRNYSCDWVYRFTPPSMVETAIGHVFVVIDPDASDAVWVDPVVSSFDQHFFYLVKQDEVIEPGGVEAAALGRIGALDAVMHPGQIGISSQEQNLLNQLNDYTLGLSQGIALSKSTNSLNAITQAVVQSVASQVPGAAQALALVKQGALVLNNAFGPGSIAARLVNDYVSNPILAPYNIIKSLFSGRTFESDNYEGARYYFYFVQGNTKYSSANFVSDADVFVGLKWFIDRLGVFISGREHIIALTQGASQYMALHGVNAYTTMDVTAVNKAVAVAQQYFNFNGGPGSWAATQGVFDATLVAIANQTHQSVEKVNAEVNSGALVIPGYNDGVTSTIKSLFNSPVAWIAAAAFIGFIIISD